MTSSHLVPTSSPQPGRSTSSLVPPYTGDEDEDEVKGPSLASRPGRSRDEVAPLSKDGEGAVTGVEYWRRLLGPFAALGYRAGTVDDRHITLRDPVGREVRLARPSWWRGVSEESELDAADLLEAEFADD